MHEIIISFLLAATFAIAMMLKGGLAPHGKILSLTLVLFTCALFLTLPQMLLFGAAWCLIFMSMGEEAGAVGDFEGGWGEYLEKGFTRSYGVKKAFQYGATAGGFMALALGGSWPMLIAGALMPVCYFIGNSWYRVYHDKSSWAYSEPFWGAMLGFAFAASV